MYLLYIYVIHCHSGTCLAQIERKKTKKHCSLAMRTLRQQIETTEKSNDRKKKNNNENSKLIIKIVEYYKMVVKTKI